MAILTYPLNGILYDAEDAEIYNCTRTSGVFAEEGHFTATVTGTREISIGPGLAWMQNEEFHGKAVYNPEAEVLTIAEADAYQTRIDRIVLRFDKLLNQTTLTVKQGTPSSNPSAPSITRDSYTYELGLYTVKVKNSSVSVSASDISSTKMDENVCGLMRDGVTRLDTQELYDQWYSWFEGIVADTDAFEQQLNLWFQQLQAGAEEFIKSLEDELDEWKDEQQNEFDDWFDNVRYVLSGDVAGKLQVEVEDAQDAADLALDQLASGWVQGYMADGDGNPLLWNNDIDNEPIMLERAICNCNDTHNSGGGAVTQQEIDASVNRYLAENPVVSPKVDETLTQYGEAADAHVVGVKFDEIFNGLIFNINFKTIALVDEYRIAALTDVALTDRSYTDWYEDGYRYDSLIDVLKAAWTELEEGSFYFATITRETTCIALIQVKDADNGDAIIFGYDVFPEYVTRVNGAWKDAVDL